MKKRIIGWISAAALIAIGVIFKDAISAIVKPYLPGGPFWSSQSSSRPPACKNWDDIAKICRSCLIEISANNIRPAGKVSEHGYLCDQMQAGAVVDASYSGMIGTDTDLADTWITLRLDSGDEKEPTKVFDPHSHSGHTFQVDQLKSDAKVTNEQVSQWWLYVGQCQYGAGIELPCWVRGKFSITERGYPSEQH